MLAFIRTQWGVVPHCRNCNTRKVQYVCAGTHNAFCGRSCQMEWIGNDAKKKKKREAEQDVVREDEQPKQAKGDDYIIQSLDNMSTDAFQYMTQWLSLADLKNLSQADKRLYMAVRKAQMRSMNYVWEIPTGDRDRDRLLNDFAPDSFYIKTLDELNWVIDNSNRPIRRIVFGDGFNQSVNNLPNSLKSLTFGKEFNQPVDKLPNSLESLTFGQEFNQPIDHLPKSLQSLSFVSRYDENFNQSVDNLPDSLKSITFGWTFNGVVNKWPKSLQTLTFKARFNRPLKNLPNSLRSLKLGHNFNQHVDNLPNSLQSVEFGYWFNQPIDNLPDSVRLIELGNNFKQPINKLPGSLQILLLDARRQWQYLPPLSPSVKVVIAPDEFTGF